LRQIAEDGASAFYEGEIAKDIVRTVRFAARNPTFLTEADLASYRPIKRDAVCVPSLARLRHAAAVFGRRRHAANLGPFGAL
jgi:gamma-glutamyltranspeptidase